MPVLNNPAEMLKHKRIWHADKKACIQIYSKDKKRSVSSRHFFGNISRATKEALNKANQDLMEVGMVPNHCIGGRKTENVTKIVALYADFDDGTMSLADVLALRPKPHEIVRTSPGKHHAYWRISGCSVARCSALLKAISQKFGSDPNVCDPNRALRMPGTVNHKYDKPHLVKIVYCKENAEPIHVEDFIETAGLEVDDCMQKPPITVAAVEQTDTAEDAADLHERVKAALQGIPADDREVWRRFGLAIHSFDASATGYNLWATWSRSSTKFNEVDQANEWAQFKGTGGITIKSLFFYCNQLKQPGGAIAYDDFSLAELYVSFVKGKLCFDVDDHTWLEFNDVIWKADKQAAMRQAKAFLESLGVGSLGKRNKTLRRYFSAAGLHNLVKLAELNEELHVSAVQFDQHPELIALKNGVLNLNSGEFRAAVPQDWLRRQANVAYDQEAKTETWVKFMKSVTCEDLELANFIRRAFAYTAFGHANLQVFFMMVGSGGNGKGVLMRTMQKLLGEYAQSIAPNLMTTAYSGNANGPTPALARLFGARMLSCPELPTGRKLDSAFIKQYAGGDEITARPTYGETFSFTPEGKLWVSTNELPEIASTDQAMWRRLIPIPFNGKFQGADADENLEKSLAEELPGIFNWLLKGTKMFNEKGLGTCKAVDAMMLKMKNDADSVGSWLTENCIKDFDASVQSSIAYEDYSSFMRRSHRRPVTQSILKSQLEAKGIKWLKKKTGNFYHGVNIRTQ